MERFTGRNEHGGIISLLEHTHKDVAFVNILHALSAYEDTGLTPEEITQLKQEIEIVYACDHEKNTECKKSGCKFNPGAAEPSCESVKQREFAKLDKDGKPIINWIKYQGKLFMRWGYQSEQDEPSAIKTRCAALEAALIATGQKCETCIYRSFPAENDRCDKCLNLLEEHWTFDVERYSKKGETE